MCVRFRAAFVNEPIRRRGLSLRDTNEMRLWQGKDVGAQVLRATFQPVYDLLQDMTAKLRKGKGPRQVVSLGEVCNSRLEGGKVSVGYDVAFVQNVFHGETGRQLIMAMVHP